MKLMKPMKRIAMPAIVVAALALSAKPGVPAAAPVQAPETEPGGEPEPDPLPDPATLLRSHDRLAFPDGFTAIQVDEAMFLLANIPYREGQPGGRGMADTNNFLRAAAVALYLDEASRAATYRADHANVSIVRHEEVVSVNPEITWHDRERGHEDVFSTAPSIAERRLWEPLPDEEISQVFRQGRHGGPHYGEGALHQSTAPAGAPVVARGFKLEPSAEESYTVLGVVQATHLYDESYVVDYDGDGHPEHRLNVEDRHFERYNYANCHVTGPSGEQGVCPGFVGSPDSFKLFVWRRWIAAGVYGEAQPRFETVHGQWSDIEARHVGVFWAGPSIAEPRPLETPIRGEADVHMGGVGILPDGGMVFTRGYGTLGFDLNDSTVTLKIGDKSPFVDLRGLTTPEGEPLFPEADRWNPDRYPVGISLAREGREWEIDEGYPPEVIEQVFEFEEHYDPSSPYFGVGGQQASRENDVVSGNARGQFGGVITTEPGHVLITTGAGEGDPRVFGTAGLTDIEGYEGLSLMMNFFARFPPPE